jgi:hypothetical protein
LHAYVLRQGCRLNKVISAALSFLSLRTTQKTEANDTSSRSHAICQVFLRDSSGKLKGKLGLVDLAGSERGSDTKQHNAQRRAESADINTSLLALKECIRALGQKSTHVPYRGSKLTLILKDCFSPDSKTTMVATVSPGASAADHSLNTLRYADRIKEHRASSKKSHVSLLNLFAVIDILLIVAFLFQVTNTSRKGKAVKSNTTVTTPSKDRLMRIATATQQADAHHQEFVQNILAEHDYAQAHVAEDILDEQTEEEEQEWIEASESHSEATGEPAQEEEEELRRTVQGVFELEEALLNQHMSNIQVCSISAICVVSFSYPCRLTGFFYFRQTQKC